MRPRSETWCPWPRSQVRAAASTETRTAELAALAAEAIARVTAEGRGKGKKRSAKAPGQPALTLVMLPPRAFIALWADMEGWTKKYDPAKIAAALTVPEWERAETVLAETVSFFAVIRTARETVTAAVPSAGREARSHAG